MMKARLTYFVVLPFVVRENAIVPGEAREAPTAVAAIRMARRVAAKGVGALAFSRTGTPATGDWDDAVVLEKAGVVPASQMQAAQDAA